MKLLSVIYSFSLLYALGAAAQGYVYAGKRSHLFAPLPIYRLVDSCAPSANSVRALGPEFTVELWYAPGPGRRHEDLTSLREQGGRSLISPLGELFSGRQKVFIEHSSPGDVVTIQLRVWENQGGSVDSWQDAIALGTAAFGTSEILASYTLGELIVDGSIVFPEPLFKFFTPITISTVCPEPSGYLLLGLTAGGLWWFRRRENR
jgi:hypothetical protein